MKSPVSTGNGVSPPNCATRFVSSAIATAASAARLLIVASAPAAALQGGVEGLLPAARVPRNRSTCW